MSGKIEIICGPMFSGKTEELIRRLKRLKYANKQYLLFKPAKDTRYSETDVLTHEQEGLPALLVENANNILEYITKIPKEDYPQVIAIDEGQFFDIYEKPDNLVTIVNTLRNHGFKVVVNGLDMDFMGMPFKIMGQLMAISDDISKLKSVCSVCGEEASMSYRLDSKIEKIEVLGGSESYQARCFIHWKKGMDDRGQ